MTNLCPPSSANSVLRPTFSNGGVAMSTTPGTGIVRSNCAGCRSGKPAAICHEPLSEMTRRGASAPASAITVLGLAEERTPQPRVVQGVSDGLQPRTEDLIMAGCFLV